MAPISRDLLESSPDKTLLIDNGNIRVRLLNTDRLPYFGRVAEEHGPKEALLIDFAHKRADLKYINGMDMANIAEDDFWADSTNEADTIMETDEKENIMLDPNLTLEGNPLEVKFEAVDEMRKQVRASKFTRSCNGVEVRYPIECNPLSTTEADKWLKRFTFQSQTYLDPYFGTIWILLATDASDGRRVMLTGLKSSPDDRITVSLLGKGGAAFKKIATEFAPLSNLNYRKYVYADYEVFKKLPLITNAGIDPKSAFFRIHVEWPVNGSVKWLCNPPLETPMVITFSPGWGDSRIGLLERSEEIDYLLILADWLFKGKTQWPSQELQPELVDEVVNLFRATSVVNDTTQTDENDDFTFKLWLILRKCSSFITLRSCLELVLKAIRCGEVTALVGNENRSTIAHMLRSPDKKVFPVARLETLTCVGLLLELGVDYMKFVMTNAFLANMFIQNVADLNNVFVDPSMAVEDQAIGLRPIHLAFQTINCLQVYVKNNPHELVSLTRRALQKFCSSKASPVYSEQLVFEVKGTVYDWVFCDTTLSDWALKRTAFHGKEPRVEHYFHFSNRIEFPHVANRVYIPRSEDEPKQPELISSNYEDLQQTFLQSSNYSAKDCFYGAATVVSHIRI